MPDFEQAILDRFRDYRIVADERYENKFCPSIGNFTIPASSWTNDTLETSGYTYYANISASGVTANDYAKVNFNRGSLSIATNAEICSTCETSANVIKIFAKNAPESSITGQYVNFKTNNSLPAIGTALNNFTWEQISQISQAGLGDAYFDIGDCKEITLNGNVGDYLTLENETLCVFILHFNYAMDGTAENNIIWGGFKTTDGVDVALVDAKVSTAVAGDICFSLNHWGAYNYGGWKGSDLRYDILGATSTAPSGYGASKTTSCVGYDATDATLTSPKANTLLAALPSDLRNVIRLWTRWVDAVGGKSTTNSGIKPTIDAISLLSEFEVLGTRYIANKYEQNHQTQMSYYASGNSAYKGDFNDPTLPMNEQNEMPWWFCSAVSVNTLSFIYAFSFINGNYNSSYDSILSLGLAPAFKT